MAMSVDELEAEIEKLDERDRIALEQRILGRGFELSDEDKAELDRRIRDLEEGRVKTIPASEVLAETRPPFDERNRV